MRGIPWQRLVEMSCYRNNWKPTPALTRAGKFLQVLASAGKKGRKRIGVGEIGESLGVLKKGETPSFTKYCTKLH